MVIVGIDPGVTGAIALLTSKGLQAVADLPVMVRSQTKVAAKGGGTRLKTTNQVDAAGLAAILREWLGEDDKNAVLVVIEKCQAMPGSIKGNPKAQMSSATFSLGLSAGIIEGVVAARGYPYELVHPATWKAALKMPKATNGNGKELARTLAQRLYPGADIARVRDHNRAEACLLARYGYEKHA